MVVGLARRRCCTTFSSSGVANPGEMITYGRWIRKPAISATTMNTPTADSATARDRTTASGRWWLLLLGVGRRRDVARTGRLRGALVHSAPNRYRGRIARSPDAQPATPPTVFGTRQRPNLALRTARRGWALARAGVLIVLTGLLAALVVATLFGLLVIAINGKLP